MSNQPRIVFIDWNGTLSKSKFWGHLEKSTNAEDAKLFNRLEESLFKTNILLLKPWMRAELTSEDVNKKLADKTGLDFDKVHNEFIKGCELMELASPHVSELINKIRRSGTKVYIATDNMDSFNRWTIPAMKLEAMFDGIVNSFAVKALKRDFDDSGKSLFFEDTLKVECVEPHETVLIDDSEDKGNLLSNYGIKYIRISDEYTLEMALQKLL